MWYWIIPECNKKVDMQADVIYREIIYYFMKNIYSR